MEAGGYIGPGGDIMTDQKKDDPTRTEGAGAPGERDDEWQELKEDVQDSLRTWARSFVKAKEEFVKGFQEVRKKDE